MVQVLAPTESIDPQARVAIVVSRFNESLTENMLRGAVAALVEGGVGEERIDVAWVPGAWELPVAAQRLAESRRYQAVICLGAVIRGQTTHDQFINQQVSWALGEIALRCRLPVLFGVLTCQSIEQALDRSGGQQGNKGSECARAALEMIDLLSKLPPVPGDL